MELKELLKEKLNHAICETLTKEGWEIVDGGDGYCYWEKDGILLREGGVEIELRRDAGEGKLFEEGDLIE